eukprot:4755008-Alexandrium_andersonii.AAC.1
MRVRLRAGSTLRGARHVWDSITRSAGPCSTFAMTHVGAKRRCLFMYLPLSVVLRTKSAEAVSYTHLTLPTICSV